MGWLDGSQQDAAQALICVVDDDPPVRHAMANLLQSAGYTPICFASAEALLASPRLAEIDVGVFDVKLGGISGLALQEQLRALKRALPVLFVSGHSDQEMEQRALQAGAIALLRKPIDVDRLLDHIERALRARGTAP